jgi:hypothetical protein
MEQEQHGPAETILQSLLTYTDHLYHNRPGMVVEDGRTKIGVRWDPVTHKVEEGQKVVYRLTKVGRKQQRVRAGVLQEGSPLGLRIVENGQLVGYYRPAGIFPEVASWMYGQIASVWKMDNEFAARWASFAFGQEHRDLKVVLAAFMLCQSRKGAPEREGGEILFYDEDYRDVGEAMCLLKANKLDFNPKMILRVRDVLAQEGVAEINRELGFGKSLRHPFFGRWEKVVDKWLRYREQNPRILQGLVKQGFRTTVMRLAQIIGYKPNSDRFFEILRWKQKQSKDGRRTLALDMEVSEAESWDGLSEEEICERIVKTKPAYKVITSLVPANVGITRAVMAAAIEVGCLSDKDLIIATPTLEELGLLKVQEVKERWEKAVKAAEDQRAANIARNVRSQEVKETLEEGADAAVQKAVEEVTRGLRVYFFVDISGSMHGVIEHAKDYLEKFLQGFPLEKTHVATFNTVGREVRIQHASAAGVRQAFRGFNAGGGTSYGNGVLALSQYKPQEDEDALFIFVGDEGDRDFAPSVRKSGLNPMAFGLLKVGDSYRNCVTNTAAQLEIPCFMIEEGTFADPYAIPRTIRALVASTPVGAAPAAAARPQRITLVQQILKTDLLQKPAWAA